MSSKKATFILDIYYQEHASWQGKVIWVNENKRQYFRSALELLKLIGQVVGPNETRGFSDKLDDHEQGTGFDSLLEEGSSSED